MSKFDSLVDDAFSPKATPASKGKFGGVVDEVFDGAVEDDIEKPSFLREVVGGTAKDIAGAYGVGTGSLVKAGSGLLDLMGFDETARKGRALGQSIQDYHKGYMPSAAEMEADLSDTTLRGLVLKGVNVAPMIATAVVPAAGAARGVAALSKSTGLVTPLAAPVAGVAAGAVTEGALTAGSVSDSIRETVEKLPEADLAGNTRYQELLRATGGNKALAREALIQVQQERYAPAAGAVSTALGAVIPGVTGVASKTVARAVSGKGASKAAETGARGALTRELALEAATPLRDLTLKQGLKEAALFAGDVGVTQGKEGIQEFGQGGAESLATEASRADVTGQDLDWTTVLKSAADEGVMGGLGSAPFAVASHPALNAAPDGTPHTPVNAGALESALQQATANLRPVQGAPGLFSSTDGNAPFEGAVPVKTGDQTFWADPNAVATMDARAETLANYQQQTQVPALSPYNQVPGMQPALAPPGAETAAGGAFAPALSSGPALAADRYAPALDAMQDEPAPATPAAPAAASTTGNATRVYTGKMNPVDVGYDVVDAADLVASHDADGNENTAFPAELQPRERDRVASQAQIRRISNGPLFDLLSASGKAADGAPIVGDGNVVESGNGRTLGIQRAYASGKAGEYRAALEARAAEFGVAPERVKGMQAPVLVRRRLTPMDVQQRAQFTREANQSDLLGMSPAETAKADAERITEDMLTRFTPSEDGDVLSRSNDGFLKEFARALGSNETASLATADGQWNRDMAERVRNAVFAKAYGSDDLLTMAAEEADPDMKNVLSALTAAAPDFARAGRDVGTANAIGEAVNFVRRTRRAGQSLDEALSQQGMFGEEISPAARDLASFISANARRPRELARWLKRLGELTQQEADARENPTAGLFGETPQRSMADLTQQMAEEQTREQAQETRVRPGGNLFGNAGLNTFGQESQAAREPARSYAAGDGRRERGAAREEAAGVAEDTGEDTQLIQQYGLPADTAFIEGKLFAKGKWQAQSGETDSGMQPSKAEAAAVLQQALKQREQNAEQQEADAIYAAGLADQLRRGERLTMAQWGRLLPGADTRKGYVRLASVSPFLVRHFGFPANNLKAALGAAYSHVTSDGGAKYPVVLLNRLPEVLSQRGVQEAPVRRNDYHSEPSAAQKEAGNYKKEHVRLHGIDVAIETQAGTMRRGVDEKGKPWETQLAYDYGYVKRTKGADGDAVDVFLGPHLTSDQVFVVNQRDGKGGFDEHKVMLGFDTEAEALAGYKANYQQGWDRFETPLVTLPVAEFKKWLRHGDTTLPVRGPVATPEERLTAADAKVNRLEALKRCIAA